MAMQGLSDEDEHSAGAMGTGKQTVPVDGHEIGRNSPRRWFRRMRLTSSSLSVSERHRPPSGSGLSFAAWRGINAY